MTNITHFLGAEHGLAVNSEGLLLGICTVFLLLLFVFIHLNCIYDVYVKGTGMDIHTLGTQLILLFCVLRYYLHSQP